MKHLRTETFLDRRNTHVLSSQPTDSSTNSISVTISNSTRNQEQSLHGICTIPHHCRINVYQHSFFPRTVYYWITLSESVVLSPSLEAFKTSVQMSKPWALDHTFQTSQRPVQCTYVTVLSVFLSFGHCHSTMRM